MATEFKFKQNQLIFFLCFGTNNSANIKLKLFGSPIFHYLQKSK